MINVFITGATGFIGKRLIPILNDKEMYLYLLTRDESKLKENLFNNTNYEWIVGDLNQPETYRSAVEKCSIIVNLAGEINNASKLEATNIEGTQQLINLIKNNTSKRIIHLSSVGVVGAQHSFTKCVIDEESKCFPKNDYEKSKFKAEQILISQINKNRLVILRPTNVFGERHPKDHLKNLFQQLSKRTYIYCSKESIVNYIYVEDVAHIIKTMIVSESLFGIFNIGGAYNMSDFFQHIIQCQNSKCKVILINRNFFRLMLAFKPLFSKAIWQKISTLHNQINYSDNKLNRNFSYKIGLKEGISRTIKYYSRNKMLDE